MTMTLELAAQRIDYLNQQLNQLLTRANAADEEHRQVHAELEGTKAQLAQVSAGGGKGEFRLIDPKTMIPDKLSTDEAPWKKWAESTRAYVAMLSPTLSLQLEKVEGLENKLTTADIDAAKVPEHHAAQLSRYFVFVSWLGGPRQHHREGVERSR